MQVEASARRVVPGRQASSLYLMSWVAVAAFGLGYIGVATTRPDLIGTVLPLAEHQMDQSSSAQPVDFGEEMVVLRKWIHELQHDLASAKSTLHDQVSHNAVILERLNAAEERLSALREVAVQTAGKPALQTAQKKTAAATAPATALAKEAARRTVTSPAWAPEVSAAADSNVRIVNSITAPIATGSVPDAAAAKTPAVPAAPRAIEIGSADTLDSLRAKWGEVAGRGGEVLAAADPRYRLSADGRAAPFTLLAGPYATAADATRACNALRAKGIACRLGGAYTGNKF